MAGTLSEPAKIEKLSMTTITHCCIILNLVAGNLTIGWSSRLEGDVNEHARKTKRSMVTGTLSEPAPIKRPPTTIVIRCGNRLEYGRKKSMSPQRSFFQSFFGNTVATVKELSTALN